MFPSPIGVIFSRMLDTETDIVYLDISISVSSRSYLFSYVMKEIENDKALIKFSHSFSIINLSLLE